MTSDIDTVDLKILAQLQKDASLTTAELAERVGVSQSPCWRRVQRLHSEGYIRSTVAIVDRHKMGLSLQIFAQLKVARLTRESRDELRCRIDSIPEILECYTLMEEDRLILKVVVPNPAWYQEFLVSVLMKLPGVTDVRSEAILSQEKATTAIPLRVRRHGSQ